MQVNSALTTLAQGASEQPTQAAGTRDEFLRLLVAQLEHQDPLQPQDGTAFVAQLAQFASLEQEAQTNSLLGVIQAGQASSVRAGFTNLVGRSVKARSDSIDLPATEDMTHSVHLGSAANKVDVVIYDSTGKAVRRMSLGPREAGDADFAWDGKTDDGVALPDGKYRVEVEATSAAGGDVDAYACISGLVSAIDFGDDGTVTFRLGQASITPADIISIER